MNENFAFSFQKSVEILMPLLVFLGTFIFGLILRKLIFKRLAKWAEQAKTELDDAIIAATKGPSIIWFLILGLFFALEFSKLPDNLVHTVGKLLLVLAVFSVTLIIANLSGRLIRIFSSKLESTLPVTSLTQNISRIAIFTIGLSVILNTLGVSITPILAIWRVGGLAVALALQDTLSNFFQACI